MGSPGVEFDRRGIFIFKRITGNAKPEQWQLKSVRQLDLGLRLC
ncbi:hypothetical protein BN871_EV_00200 [Paenibacillus sp. P22]|nr:hypothetical protein BN871_EV_00200 [Paenibacillus sp. P22]